MKLQTQMRRVGDETEARTTLFFLTREGCHLHLSLEVAKLLTRLALYVDGADAPDQAEQVRASGTKFHSSADDVLVETPLLNL